MDNQGHHHGQRQAYGQGFGRFQPSQEEISRAEEMALLRRELQEQEEMALLRRDQQRQQSYPPFASSPSSYPRERQPSIPSGRLMMPYLPSIMNSSSDVRYLQEMRKAEEMIMSRNSMPSSHPATMSSSSHYSMSSNQWSDTASLAHGPNIPQDHYDSHSYLPFEQVVRMSSSRPSAPLAQALDHDPAMLRALLQREEMRLLNMKRQSEDTPESWLPFAKRPAAMMEQVSCGGQRAPRMLSQQEYRAHASKLEQKERRRLVKSFPVKLMEAITEFDDETVFAWLPDGKSIVVSDTENFANKVLANSFKGGKYSSFVRKLNRWGFSRLISGTGLDCFYHPLFQKDRPELCALITARSEVDDTVGVDPALLGDKPSLSGIEKYFATKIEAIVKTQGETYDESHVDAKEKAKKKVDQPSFSGEEKAQPKNVEGGVVQ